MITDVKALVDKLKELENAKRIVRKQSQEDDQHFSREYYLAEISENRIRPEDKNFVVKPFNIQEEVLTEIFHIITKF